jgi:hypothetical protein
MAQTDTDASAKITAAMFAQLLNKLTEKGVLDKTDVEQMMVEATKMLPSSSGLDGFGGLAGRHEGEIGDQQQQTVTPGR